MVNLLFDYDGTLHDSLRIYAPAFQTAYDRLAGLGYVEPRAWTPEEIRRWIGLPPGEMWARFQPDLPEAEKERSGALIGKRMLELIQAGKARLYPGVPEALTALRQAGFRLLLLSNCPNSYLQAHAARFGLDTYFHGLYCGEQFGYRPKYEICRELQDRYDGEFLVIGDRRQDMEIAERNGLRAVGCSYGYGSAEELSGAAWTAETPFGLLACVSRAFPDACGALAPQATVDII